MSECPASGVRRPASQELYAIVAHDQNGVIGDGLKLPWHKPEDLRFFKETTLGHAVIMGRKSFDAIARKPLPGRPNVVITRQEMAAPGFDICHSLDEAIACARTKGRQPPFVIGGGDIYRQATLRRLITRFYITEIQAEHPGDVHFPRLDPAQWVETSRRVSADRSMIFRILELIP